MKAYLLGALVFIAAIIVFITQNDSTVAVQFLGWRSSEISLAVVMLISVCAGALLTFLLDSYRALKTGQKVRKLLKLNQKYEDEIRVLKGRVNAPGDNPGADQGTPGKN
ncbi:MAG: LapA family protein [Syntrophomonadaceae bacterium]|nr:LapA family protein [Syntrophomonadaceae bacterium]